MDSEPSDDEPPVTLDECLERFTRPERLGSEAKIRLDRFVERIETVYYNGFGE